ncbi:RAP domain-containing protein [Endozoicomonas sp. ALB091]|uniref:RAP domain-containing protein n=2 Tax=unclassified Endozoicomonas TaxID=2644528 RepID=UPI003BB6BF81
MDRGGSGISWKNTTSGNDYKKTDVQATASGSGQYRHGTVRKVNVPLSYIQKRNEGHPASDACSANHPPGYSVKPVHGFNTLITPEKMDWLAGISAHYGDHYDGKTHSQFACSIKRYTSGGKRPLNHSEQRQLIPLLHDFKVTPGWTWRSLTTTLHSFTSAGVLIPHKYMNKGDRETQAALLTNLLDAVINTCNQKPEAWDIDVQGVANLLWALAKLVDNGLELEKTEKLKEALATLLYHVKTKAEAKEEGSLFNTQGTVSLLWTLGKLGEAIEPNLINSTFGFLVDRISKNPQLSQQYISMSLWGVMAFCARVYLDSGRNNKNPLEKHIGELFSRLGNTSPDNIEVQTVIAMAASWLGRACPVVPYYRTVISEPQSAFCDQLQSSLPSLTIEEEKSLNSLPPVDLLLSDYNTVIDVQGPSHYVSGDFKTRNGSTLLKIALLQKARFEVIEIPVNKIDNQDSMNIVIEQIKAKYAVLPKAHGSVSLNSGEWVADEAYFTADDGGQFSDDCYFTAEEYLEEQTKKPKKRKRKRNRPVKTAAC